MSFSAVKPQNPLEQLAANLAQSLVQEASHTAAHVIAQTTATLEESPASVQPLTLDQLSDLAQDESIIQALIEAQKLEESISGEGFCFARFLLSEHAAVRPVLSISKWKRILRIPEFPFNRKFYSVRSSSDRCPGRNCSYAAAQSTTQNGAATASPSATSTGRATAGRHTKTSSPGSDRHSCFRRKKTRS